MGSSNSLDFLTQLPHAPGVYKMFSGEGTVIYVGKARDLKKRVSSYFQKSPKDAKTRALVNAIKKIELVVTRSETEALLLEADLIKRAQPKFNVAFRDDKSYPYLFLSTEDPFPRLAYYRGNTAKKGRYFGPYPAPAIVKDILCELTKIFQLRTCRECFFKHRTRPCLQYQIKRCSAPCVGLISTADYQKDVRHAILLLEGKNKEILQEYKKNMKEASRQLDFEAAAKYRDRRVRLQKFCDELRILKKNARVEVVTLHLDVYSQLRAVEEALGSQSSLNWIECFDVSHTAGIATVASCVVFENGQSRSHLYRRYNIKDIQTGDDYAALRQTLLRRYKKRLEESERLPDLILIDGGRGQLHQAEQVLDQLRIHGVALVAVAKGESRKPGCETLFRSGQRTPLILPPDSPALHFIQTIRDEAHRFACASHQKRRGKLALHSILEDIPQIGPKRRQLLLTTFGGLQGLKQASQEALSKVSGISLSLAGNIYQALRT
ncbi:MAG: excinuclease ABC subunit UvrC [Gammaproteobacteria bacterium]|nr:excinuclease ABC subunit UvrC [Gammaproteobacteria bacterium]